MKNFIKQTLKESLDIHIIESLIDEDYPMSWNIEEFKKLKSFNKRIQYCKTNLKRIAEGSSRIVYQVDDTKVLKLAKNRKGVAQNEIEINYSYDTYVSSIVAEIFAKDENNLWVEMELARKVTAPIFQQVTGFKFSDYCAAINNHWLSMDRRNKGYKQEVAPEIVAEMWENEFCMGLFDFIGSYDMPAGDLMKLNSFGLVKRGEDAIVLIDYGLTNDVYQSYYS